MNDKCQGGARLKKFKDHCSKRLKWKELRVVARIENRLSS